MPRIVFVRPDGSEQEVAAAAGQSLMVAAVNAGIDAIVAECGGACSCGTCHCHIAEDWHEQLPPPAQAERDMLECVINPSATSRLSCQLRLSEDMDGLKVHLPATQY